MSEHIEYNSLISESSLTCEYGVNITEEDVINLTIESIKASGLPEKYKECVEAPLSGKYEEYLDYRKFKMQEYGIKDESMRKAERDIATMVLERKYNPLYETIREFMMIKTRIMNGIDDMIKRNILTKEDGEGLKTNIYGYISSKTYSNPVSSFFSIDYKSKKVSPYVFARMSKDVESGRDLANKLNVFMKMFSGYTDSLMMENAYRNEEIRYIREVIFPFVEESISGNASPLPYEFKDIIRACELERRPSSNIRETNPTQPQDSFFLTQIRTYFQNAQKRITTIPRVLDPPANPSHNPRKPKKI